MKEFYLQLVPIIFIIIICFKIYYVYQIAKGRQHLSPMFGYFLINSVFWAFPILRKAKDDQEQKLIRKANIITIVLWIFFFVVVFSSVLFV